MTAQSVSRYLAKEGHSRSRTLSSRIRGWSNSTAGFEVVTTAYDGTKGVSVDYVVGRGGTDREVEMAKLRETLEKHYTVTRQERGISHYVFIVTEKENE